MLVTLINLPQLYVLSHFFLKTYTCKRGRPLILLVDHATFHGSKQVRDFVRAHRSQLRVFFLPKRAPEFNPDEQVWNEIKNNRIADIPHPCYPELAYKRI